MSIRGVRLDLVAASEADVPEMRVLVRSAYEQHVPRIGREPAPMTADYDGVVRSGRSLLAKTGSELVGLVVTAVEEDALLIENLAVLPRSQGSGVGSLLLQKAEDLAREAGLSEVRLYTNEAMTENTPSTVEGGSSRREGPCTPATAASSSARHCPAEGRSLVRRTSR